jgi:hypothetical protein
MRFCPYFMKTGPSGVNRSKDGGVVSRRGAGDAKGSGGGGGDNGAGEVEMMTSLTGGGDGGGGAT